MGLLDYRDPQINSVVEMPAAAIGGHSGPEGMDRKTVTTSRARFTGYTYLLTYIYMAHGKINVSIV